MKKLYPYLTYAGALPFMGCVLCLMLDIQQLPWLGATRTVFSVYALVIVTFMAGSHWGQHLSLSGAYHLYLPIFSNLIAVSVWLAFLLMAFENLMVTLILLFVTLLVIDYKLFESAIITRDYFTTRCYVTAMVVISLTLALLTG